jgi:Fur family ferric uptake transcriptional regulator
LKNPLPSRAIANFGVEARCRACGPKLTARQRLIVGVIAVAHDHPDFNELYRRVEKHTPNISRSTVARTLKLLASVGIVERVMFQDGRYRYEPVSGSHHDHLIDLKSGEVCEFNDPDIERLQKEVAVKLGYKLIGHRLALYAIRLPGLRRRSKDPA